MAIIYLHISQNEISFWEGNRVRFRTVAPDECPAKPILKWAGGKQWLAPAAQQLRPPGWTGTYHEPFLGGAAFFLALAPRRAMVSDANAELINTYRALIEEPEHIIDILQRYPYERKFYYKLRDTKPRLTRFQAARFLYLNRACWNGLYRVNRAGQFNTPFGKYTNPTIVDPNRVRAAVRVLSGATLTIAHFDGALDKTKAGDFVYCDPPYITGHQNNGFIKYNAHLFSWADQERLAARVIRLKQRGVHVLVSNADHPSVLRLYSGLYYYRVVRRSLIAAATVNRGLTTEALLSTYPLAGLHSEVI